MWRTAQGSQQSIEKTPSYAQIQLSQKSVSESVARTVKFVVFSSFQGIIKFVVFSSFQGIIVTKRLQRRGSLCSMHVQCMFKRLIHRDLLHHFWPKTSEVWNDGTKLHCETNGLKSLWCFRRFKRYRWDWVPFQRDIFGCWDVENHKMLAATLANLGMFDAEASDEFIHEITVWST